MTRPEPVPEPPVRFSPETEWLLAELLRQRTNALVGEAVRAGRWPVAQKVTR